MQDKVSYAGKDLEAMSFARNYHQWILDVFRPYLGKRLVEVGAGTGSFSELLADQGARSISLVEPSGTMFQVLQDRIPQFPATIEFNLYNALFEDVFDQIRMTQHPDSIIYVNVIEHIDDDQRELKIVWRTLDAGGRVFIFVPAFQWLYGNFDKGVGHFRRYTKAELESKCRDAGFKILKSTYFDLMGVLPWWIQYRLLRASTLKPGAVKFYDSYLVSITKAFESLVAPPFGKNLLVIGERIG
ncbi:MAG: class I SAM-dependent methyltransferase [Acidobacteriota bacterium]|nr:class I SAM-dependent methyltransferase [Acidobacteriota bacterium]